MKFNQHVTNAFMLIASCVLLQKTFKMQTNIDQNVLGIIQIFLVIFIFLLNPKLETSRDILTKSKYFFGCYCPNLFLELFHNFQKLRDIFMVQKNQVFTRLCSWWKSLPRQNESQVRFNPGWSDGTHTIVHTFFSHQ